MSMSTRNRKVGDLLPGLISKKKEKMWVSPSKLRNALLNDHMADYINLKTKRNATDDPFLKFLFDQGSVFKDAVLRHISSTVCPVLDLNGDFRKKSSDLKALMQRGVPILACVPLKNHYSAVRGVADLLVRSDYVNKIVPSSYSEEEEKKQAPKLQGCAYHYVVIEIKFSTIFINHKMEVLESPNIPFISQAYIYSRALFHIQGYMASAFIIGRKYHVNANCGLASSDTLTQPLSLLGKVKVSDNVIERTFEAAKWVRRLHREVQRGNSEFVSSISVNMCASKDEEKKKIAKERCELTLISTVGQKEKETAFERGVVTYMDPLCSASVMGIRNMQRAKMVDAIIDVNRSDDKVYRFDEDLRTIFSTKSFLKKTNIFLDFETISDLFCNFDKFPNIQSSSFIFLAGILINNKYTAIPIDDLSLNAERRLLINLTDVLNSFGKNAIIWYWYAEKNFLTTALKRHPDLEIQILPEMVDLHAILRNSCFAVKGCFTYGLKDMTKAMSERKLINCNLEADCQDGMTASVTAWRYYTEGKKDRAIFADIERYNHFDCYAMERIYDFLKKQIA